MKVGIVGTGSVGCACATAAVNRGSAREVVRVNRTRKTAEAIATDLRYGTPLTPEVEIVNSNYDVLPGASVMMITSGVNEKTGACNEIRFGANEAHPMRSCCPNKLCASRSTRQRIFIKKVVP